MFVCIFPAIVWFVNIWPFTDFSRKGWVIVLRLYQFGFDVEHNLRMQKCLYPCLESIFSVLKNVYHLISIKMSSVFIYDSTCVCTGKCRCSSREFVQTYVWLYQCGNVECWKNISIFWKMYVASLFVEKKSETCLYKGCKCCSWQFDFLSEISRSLFEIARSCMSAKQRISLESVSVKIMILWNDKSIRTWNTEKHM